MFYDVWFDENSIWCYQNETKYMMFNAAATCFRLLCLCNCDTMKNHRTLSQNRNERKLKRVYTESTAHQKISYFIFHEFGIPLTIYTFDKLLIKFEVCMYEKPMRLKATECCWNVLRVSFIAVKRRKPYQMRMKFFYEWNCVCVCVCVGTHKFIWYLIWNFQWNQRLCNNNNFHLKPNKCVKINATSTINWLCPRRKYVNTIHEPQPMWFFPYVPLHLYLLHNMYMYLWKCANRLMNEYRIQLCKINILSRDKYQSFWIHL